MNRSIVHALVFFLLPAAAGLGLAGPVSAAAPDAGAAASAAATQGTGEPAAAAPSDAEATFERRIKVVVRGADGEPAEVTISPEDGEAGGVHAVFVGADGEVETLPGLPGGPHAFRLASGLGAEPRGYLGIGLTDLTPELRAHFGAPEDAGVMVSRVEPGSPAEAAGVAVGDLVTAIDGERVATSRDVRRKVRTLDDGDAVAIEVRRDGRVVDLNATVVEREVPEIDARRFFWKSADGPGATYEIDPEAMGEEVKRLTEHFSGPEFQGRLRHLKALEGDLGKRLDELEAKIADLERQLAESREKGGG
jgi:membrane-associated protease RseP (regulator of RpoE activity)